MQRRNFLKSTSLLTLPLILKSCDWLIDVSNYHIDVQSDMDTGHLLLDNISFDQTKVHETETLIVGGGIAGLSAACRLKGKDFILCELSNDLGGTSSANVYGGMQFAQGAHYDLEYPANYGQEVLHLLEELKIIQYQSWKDSWGFVDQQHIILHRRKNRCFDHGEFREDVLPAGPMKSEFIGLLDQFESKMVLPTRLISDELKYLNDISFFEMIRNKMSIDQGFELGLDYHMKDDYGAGCKEVSALAGIHYFICRPYYKEVVDLFSPPNGNHYFIEKMRNYLMPSDLRTKHMVCQIQKEKNGWIADVIDVNEKKIIRIKTKHIVYAGQKHALKYIYPKAYESFSNNQYAPWMVVSIITDDKLPTPGYWQNEMLTQDTTFLGFVDSDTQHHDKRNKRVLTGYYCLPTFSRGDLKNVGKNKEIIARATVEHISKYFKMDINKHVEKVFIKVMGHAMPIPYPGYLFDDRNLSRKENTMSYAGVDNGRLPLLFEAIDSGLSAINTLSL